MKAIASATPRSSDSTPGKRRRRVDEHHDRPAELLRELHHAQRLAIAFRPRVAEVAEDLLLGVAALLVADDADRLAFVVGEAADDRVIVGEAAVAVQLVEAGEQRVDVVERVGPRRMPRDQHPLPRRQVRVELGPDLVGAPPQRLDRALPLRRLRQHAERLDLLQQDADGFFEFE